MNVRFAVAEKTSMANEAQDGFGLPGPSPCGAAVLPETDLYVLGYGSIPTSR